MSPAKDGTSSLPRRSSNLGKPPLRALYDLLIAPMEGVSSATVGAEECTMTENAKHYNLKLVFILLLCVAGLDALQWTSGQTQAAGDGAGGGTIPDPLCSAKRKLL